MGNIKIDSMGKDLKMHDQNGLIFEPWRAVAEMMGIIKLDCFA